MTHSYISLDTSLIPQSTKDNTNYSRELFSNDGSRVLLDGYGADGNLVHTTEILFSWLQWEADPSATLELILNNSIEYTKDEMLAEREDLTSIWYAEPEVLL